MDAELLMALLVMWTGSTVAMVIFLIMWFANDGAAFHPHSVDIENRHPAFYVVNSRTICKKDCAVKSVSAFVAPRGSTSSKYFTALSMVIAISGMLGTTRWYFVGDATPLQMSLAFCGFGSLMLIAGFELDVAPERFLEDKLLVTGWLIQKLKLNKKLPFRLVPQCKEFREFIRNSPEIYHLYEEDRSASAHKPDNLNLWNADLLSQSAHMLGAIMYVLLVPLAIILNDNAEEKVVWITGSMFIVFCGVGYFTGNYIPVVNTLRGWVLAWNPFLREPHYMLKLKRSVEAYLEAQRRQGMEEYTSEEHWQVDDASQQQNPLSMDDASVDTGVVRRRTRAATARGAKGANGINGSEAQDYETEEHSAFKNRYESGGKSNPAGKGRGRDSGGRVASPSSDDSGGEQKGHGRSQSRGRSRSVVKSRSAGTGTGIEKEGQNGQRSSSRARGGRTPAKSGSGRGSGESQGDRGGRSARSRERRNGRVRGMSHGEGHSTTDIDYARHHQEHAGSDSDHQLHDALKKIRPWAQPVDRREAAEVDKCLDNISLRFARTQPVLYLRVISYVLVMTELVAMMTPCVAMGIQWITALCEGPPLIAIIELLYETFKCVTTWGLECQLQSEDFNHCILK